MSDKASQMNINIGKRVRTYLIVIGFILVFMIWGDFIIKTLLVSLSGSAEDRALLEMITKSLIVVGGVILTLVLNIGRDIDLHNLLDSKIFGLREETHRVILENLENAARDVGAEKWDAIRQNPSMASRIFYHFANKEDQKVLRGLAFTYWEQYFVNIYIVVLSLTAALIGSLFIFSSSVRLWLIFLPILLVVLAIIFAVRTFGSLKRKILDLPAQQIEEIKATHPKELKDQIDLRF